LSGVLLLLRKGKFTTLKIRDLKKLYKVVEGRDETFVIFL